MHPLPTTEAEIDAFLSGFESGTLPKKRWTHSAHIFSGACYVHRLGEAAAIDHMRLSVRHYNEAVGGQNTETSGYHETVTVFWIKLLAALHANHSGLSRADFAGHAVTACAHRRDLFAHFYDFDVIASTEARRIWHPPNRQPITAAVL